VLGCDDTQWILHLAMCLNSQKIDIFQPVTFSFHLWSWPLKLDKVMMNQYENIYLKGHVVRKLLSRQKHTYVYTRQINCSTWISDKIGVKQQHHGQCNWQVIQSVNSTDATNLQGLSIRPPVECWQQISTYSCSASDVTQSSTRQS